uniref:protein-tyrosine-phosphatase n=1 Tax=Macrostomum lignano TaxID=282301 RepID=A0A1I8IJX6_9PLAT
MQVTERSQRVRMSCYAQGARPMRYQWTRSEVRLDLSRPRLQLSNGSLIIEKVLPEDDGKYQCSVTNSVGTVYSEPAHLYVRVRKISPHFSTRPSSMEVPAGSNVNLTCVAVGAPMPRVQWFDSKGTDLGSNEPGKQQIGRFVLMLTDVTSDDNYTCQAQNSLGTIHWMVSVTVQKMPEPPSDL